MWTCSGFFYRLLLADYSLCRGSRVVSVALRLHSNSVSAANRYPEVLLKYVHRSILGRLCKRRLYR